MKQTRTVHKLSTLKLEGNNAELQGANGKIFLSSPLEGIYRIEYLLDSHIPGSAIQNAAKNLYDSNYNSEDLSGSVLTDISNNDTDNFIFARGGDKIIIRKTDAVTTILHRNKIVHGGEIGNSDTVLPRYPLRILGGTKDNARARFNFKLKKDDRFYGLGDKTGNLNKRGQRFLMSNRDALGYEASKSDPLYKSIPFLIKHNPENSVFSGLYFPALCVTEIDLGRESPYFISAGIEGGPFTYVVFTGDSAWDILKKFTWLTGMPSLPPLYTFGFLGSSMNYTEPDEAEQRVTQYFDRIEKNNIPCEGFYFSSGYVKADNGKRYTFEWNKRKFPNPGKTINQFRKRGYHIACNVKPGFLTTHPRYNELDDKGYFIKDSDGESYKEYYWGGNASFIDFNNPDALNWWKKQLKENFVDYGVSGIWNDNNELELEDQNLEAQRIRSIYPVLMAKASWEVFKESNPGKRPWIISRSGGPGLQKYARTWTGDNVSDWESMKYNLLMGMGLGLSGIPYYGHDIGGFFGKQPDNKQFIRWCQTAVFQPRFVIHSWNANGNPTEIWAYPESIDIIRELVELHYEFMPYIYNTAIEASLSGIPMERPLTLMFPEDKKIDPDSLNYMFGEDILVVSAVEENEEKVDIYFPDGTRWKDPLSGKIYNGNQNITVDYPYKRIRYFLREGSVVFTSPNCRKLNTGYFESLQISILPSRNEQFIRVYREDNGEDTFLEGSHNKYSISVDFRTSEGELIITKEATALTAPTISRKIDLVLPDNFVFISIENSECKLENPNKLSMKNLPDNLKLKFKSNED